MKESYRQKIEAQLKEWDDQIEAMEHKAKRVEQKEISIYDTHIQDMKAKREMLAGKLEELHEVSEEKWGSFKPGLVAAVKSLQEEFSKVIEKMR